MGRDNDAVLEGVLFAQRKGGADHFTECQVTLNAENELLVEAVAESARPYFDRGLSLRQFSCAALSRKASSGLMIIRLELLGQPAFHLATESEAEGKAWAAALARAVRVARAADTCWALLNTHGAGPELAGHLRSLSKEVGSAAAQQTLGGELALHRVCRGLGQRAGVSRDEADLVELLVKLFPGGVEQADDAGALALHLALECPSGEQDDDESMRRIVVALSSTSGNTVLARREDPARKRSQLPMHLACSKLNLVAGEVLVQTDCPVARLDAFVGEPGHLMQRDETDGTPLHAALEALSAIKGQRGKEQARQSGRRLCSMLAMAEPAALLARNARGDNPVHMAARIADSEVVCAFASQPAGLAACLATDRDGFTPLEILLQMQRQLQRSGKRGALFSVERCISVLRLGADSEIVRAICAAESSSGESDLDDAEEEEKGEEAPRRLAHDLRRSSKAASYFACGPQEDALASMLQVV